MINILNQANVNSTAIRNIFNPPTNLDCDEYPEPNPDTIAVHIAAVPVPLEDSDYDELKQTISPLEHSDYDGEDIYGRVLIFVVQKRRHRRMHRM